MLEQRFVEAAPGAVVDIFRTGPDITQARGAHSALEPFGPAACGLTVDEQPQPFGVGKIGGSVLCLKLGKGVGHAIKPEGSELIQRWMCQHLLSFLSGSNPRVPPTAGH